MIFIATICWTVFISLWLLMVLISCIEKSRWTCDRGFLLFSICFIGFIFFRLRYRYSNSAILVSYRGPESVWLLSNVYNKGEIESFYDYYYHIPHEQSYKYQPNSAEDDFTNFVDEKFRSRVKPVDGMCMKWLLITICFVIFTCKTILFIIL